jgi:hypothetical protein
MEKTLNDIIPPSRRRTLSTPEMGLPSSGSEPPRSYPPIRSGGSRRRFPLGTALVALIVLLLCAGALYAFAGAEVEVRPTVSETYVSGDFTATTGGELPFEVVAIEKIATKSVPAESTEQANDPAQGRITIYNKQGNAQTLIKNTRFETPEGLVYRIHDSVTVPAGSDAAPGTIEVTVYADAGGDRYNIGPADFTLPGLRGSGAFDLVYAKSTGSMTGGFVGERPSVGQSTKARESTALRQTLASELTESIQGEVPEGYILIPGATITRYEDMPESAGASGDVDIRVKGTMQAVVFPNEALAKAIAFKTVGSYGGQPVTIIDASKLTLTPQIGDVAPVGVETYGFVLSGDTAIAWNVDKDRIAGAVAGKTRESAQVVLTGFPEVDRATLILRPFWTTTFPDDPGKITVSVSDPSN